MKIKSASLYLYKRVMGRRKREGLLLKLEGQEGLVRWGEAAPLPGFSKETFDEAREELLLYLAPLLMRERISPLPSVRFGVDMALLDGAESSPLLVNALLTGGTQEILTAASKVKEQGYLSAKIKIGPFSLDEALKLMEGLDSIFKQKVSIRIDANRSWTLDKALRFAEKAPSFEYFEEPFHHFEDYLAFPYPVALDESLRIEDPSSYFSLPFLKAFIVKPTLIGNCFYLHQKAQEKGVAFILSSSYESELGIGLIARLAAHLKLPPIPMGLDTYRQFRDTLFFERIQMKEGKLFFPKKWNLKPETCQMIAHECF